MGCCESSFLTEKGSSKQQGRSKHEEDPPTPPRSPLSPRDDARSRLDLAAIHQVSVTSHDDERTNEVPSDVMLGISEHEEAPPTPPRRPVSPMIEACLRLDLAFIHELLVRRHYGDDEWTSEFIQEWTKQTNAVLEARRRGDFAFRDKDFKTAIDFYSQFINVGNMVTSTVFVRRSLCYLFSDEADAALADALQARIMNPEWRIAFCVQLVAFLKLDMHKDAEDMLNEAIRQENQAWSR